MENTPCRGLLSRFPPEAVKVPWFLQLQVRKKRGCFAGASLEGGRHGVAEDDHRGGGEAGRNLLADEVVQGAVGGDLGRLACLFSNNVHSCIQQRHITASAIRERIQSNACQACSINAVSPCMHFSICQRKMQSVTRVITSYHWSTSDLQRCFPSHAKRWQ